MRVPPQESNKGGLRWQKRIFTSMGFITTPRKVGSGMKNLTQRRSDKWFVFIASDDTSDPGTPQDSVPAPEPPYGVEPPINTGIGSLAFNI